MPPTIPNRPFLASDHIVSAHVCGSVCKPSDGSDDLCLYAADSCHAISPCPLESQLSHPEDSQQYTSLPQPALASILSHDALCSPHQLILVILQPNLLLHLLPQFLLRGYIESLVSTSWLPLPRKLLLL